MVKKTILFVDKGNRFRSKIAERYFKKINKNKEITAKSRGLIYCNPIKKSTQRIIKELDININVGTSKRLKENELKKASKIIVVANDVPPSLFEQFSNDIEVWKIPDCNGDNKNQIINITKQIIKRVDSLNKQLNEGKFKVKKL